MKILREDFISPIDADGFLYFDLEVNPEPWRVGPVSVGRKRNGGGMYPVVGRDQQLHAYKMAVKEQLERYQTFLLPGLYAAKYYFWRKRDVYRTQHQMDHRKHEADLTNLVKATEDACQEILFGNDRDCVWHHCYMMDQDAEAIPRVVVGVTPLGVRPKASEAMSAELMAALGIEEVD